MDCTIETPTVGEILREEFMEPMNISAYKLAQDIMVPVSRIQDILHGRRKITADTSLRLSKYFGVSERYFLKETSAQDLKTACTALDIEVLQTEIKHIDRIRSLPRYKDHGDPFDRLIICQALSEKLPLITSDGKMSRYGVQVIW